MDNTVSIIGAGVAGLSLAVELARMGARVRVYDYRFPGYGATGHSAGILVTILDEPLLDLALESLEFYKQLPGARAHWAPRRSLWIVPQEGCARRVLEAHERRGLKPKKVENPSRALGVQFKLGPGEEAWAVQQYLVDTGWIPGALEIVAESLGVEIVAERVVRSGGWYYTSRGDPLEGIVVVAAGAWTPGLVPEVGRLLRIYRCQASTVRGIAPRLIIEDDVKGYYLVPFGVRWYNIGDGANSIIDDPEKGYKPDPEDPYRVLEAFAERVSAAWDATVEQTWSAPCSVGIDGMPVAAWVDDVFVYSGLDGAGISLAPGLSRIVARHLLEDAPLPEWVSRLDREEAPRWPTEPYDIC